MPDPEIGYYRLVKPIKPSIGELVYMAKCFGDEVKLIVGDDTWTLELDKFLDHYEFEPDGLTIRQKQMFDLMNEMHQATVETDDLLVSASSTPHLEDKEREIQEEQKDIAGLPAIRKNPIKAEVALKTVKTAFARTKASITSRQAALAEMIEEQKAILNFKTAELTKQIAMATEAIFVINTYLGNTEEIVHIRKGKPASANEKIVMRQQILYMDEETAIIEGEAERGGIDFQNIPVFDKWICKHYNKLIPDKKGIIAFNVRRNEKHYSDNIVENYENNKLNKVLYLLIRNGENLYRIYSSLPLRDVIFPHRSSFEETFYKSEYDFRLERTVSRPLNPGSEEYMKAMEKSEKQQRLYFTVMILFQGLLDRTKIFHPMPNAERVNICNLEDCEKYIKFLYDDENLIDSGRLPFRKWLQSVNAELDVGHRIVGEFWHGSWEKYGTKRSEDRVTPIHAGLPKNNTIYTVESKDHSNYIIKFKNSYHKNRASYRLHPSDDFFIDIDVAEIDDMNFYINSRVNRHHYMDMIPLMRSAIKAKEEEIEQEKDFRSLLIGQILKQFKVDLSKAQDKVDELIRWWKIKNKTRRALLSDDSKALRMITSEFKRRVERQSQQQKYAERHALVVAQIKEERPNALAIFHRKDDEYVVFLWHNKEDVFVVEEEWKTFRSIRPVEQSEVKTVDNRFQSWHLIWNHERWDKWKINARESDYLNDNDIAQAVEFIKKEFKENIKKYLEYKEFKGKIWNELIGVSVQLSNRVSVKHSICGHFVHRHAAIPKENFYTNESAAPVIVEMEITWTKKKSICTFAVYRMSQKCYNFDRRFLSRSEETKTDLPWLNHPENFILLNQKTIEELNQAIAEYIAHYKERCKISNRAWSYAKQIGKHLEYLWLLKEKEKFDAQYIDTTGDLWEDHKEKLKKNDRETYPDWFTNAMGYIIERDLPFIGLTVEQIITQAKTFGYDMKETKNEQYEKVKGLTLKEIDEEDEDDDD